MMMLLLPLQVKAKMTRRFFFKALAFLSVSLKMKWALADDSAELPPAQRWQALTPEEKEGLRQKWRAFKKLTPAQQKKLRERFQKFRAIPQARRTRILRAFRRWKSMTQEQRQRFKDKLKSWRALHPRVRSRHRRQFR